MVKNKFILIPLFFLGIDSAYCQLREKNNFWDSQNLNKPQPYSQIISQKYYGPEPKLRKEKDVSAILIHSTKGLSLKEFLDLSWKNQWNLHFLIDKKGNLYGDPYAPIHIYPTSPGIDAVAIHIALEGKPEESKKNEKQWKSLLELVQKLSNEFNIPKTNYDVSSKKGIFTHNQVKKKFGRFIDLIESGEETLLASLLSSIQGKYYEEKDWKDRFGSGWVLRKENLKAIQSKFKPNRGRGITPTPKAELNSIEKTNKGLIIESRRLQYEYRGKIQPSCVVLHYTAISSYDISIQTLEKRNLTATIMVDKDGKAYQLLDSLNDKAAAAYGTNDNCIQIEIVGKNTAELLQNTVQMETVVKLVQELSKKFKFPLDNYKIESHKGVFSHTQAKKRFGGSAFLVGNDFDPGEEYMEFVLKNAGGKYYPEKQWFNRQSFDWIILDKEFQP